MLCFLKYQYVAYFLSVCLKKCCTSPVCIFKTNAKFPDRGEMHFPLFKLYACNNNTNFAFFLFDLAEM